MKVEKSEKTKMNPESLENVCEELNFIEAAKMNKQEDVHGKKVEIQKQKAHREGHMEKMNLESLAKMKEMDPLAGDMKLTTVWRHWILNIILVLGLISQKCDEDVGNCHSAICNLQAGRGVVTRTSYCI